jgi:predicted molibdopterin-dependent oxidoreductase YjgC
MGAGWSYESTEQIWEEVRKLAPNFAGVTYARLEEGGLQWPCPDETHPGTAILHERLWAENVGMKAPFMPTEYQPPAEPTDEEYPLTLTTGRRLQFYNTGVQTNDYEKVKNAEESLELSEDDAALYGFEDGDLVKVSSRRGTIQTKIKISKSSPIGLAFMSFHFPDQVDTNRLTINATDPLAGTAEFKACAIKLEKVEEQANNNLR